MLISIYALNVQEEIPTEALLLSDHRLSVLTTNNTEHSKAMTIKFLLNICIKYKIILGSTSFFLIYLTQLVLQIWRINKQRNSRVLFPPYPNLFKFLTTFFSPQPPLTSENLQSCNLLALMLHFQVIAC